MRMAITRTNRTIGGDRGAAGPRPSPVAAGDLTGSSQRAGGGGPTRLRWRRNLCLGLAVITCPCHLPILAALLSGTAAGASLSENLGLGLILLLGAFAVPVRAAVRLSR